ncbi:MAG: hypothetical protein ACK5NL_23670, partial [Vibrio fluvialis]
LVISTDRVGQRVPQHRNAIDAAVRAGVGHILYTSSVNPVEESPVAVNDDHRQTELALAASGIPFTALRNALYVDLQVPDALAAAATGKFVTNQGKGRFAPVSRADCAAAAAGALVTEDPLDRTYDVTGPELIDAATQAELFGRLAGIDVEVVDIDDEAFAANAVEHGVPAEMAPALTSFGTGIRQGYLESVTDAVEKLAGRPAAGFQESLEPMVAAAG